MSKDQTVVTTEEYFGGCPKCGQTGGYRNVGAGLSRANGLKWKMLRDRFHLIGKSLVFLPARLGTPHHLQRVALYIIGLMGRIALVLISSRRANTESHRQPRPQSLGSAHIV